MTGSSQLASVHAFVDELWRAGVRHVCISPGSRSTPLTVSFAEHGGYQLHILLDERSGGYFALGLSRRLQEPVALVCTSGTAAGNYHPAVMEASRSHVPLVVLTADRPPELQEVGANQTIRQSGMFGVHVRFSLDMPVPSPDAALVAHAAATAWRVVAAATFAAGGPVHVNWPFREPLLPAPSVHRSHRVAGGLRSLAVPQLEPPAEVLERMAEDLRTAHCPLLVCGPQVKETVARVVVELSARLHVPLLADPLSQIRTLDLRTDEADHVVDAYDWVADADLAAVAPADCVIRFGDTVTSKGLGQYLQALPESVQWVVTPDPQWPDPGRSGTDVCVADPEAVSRALMDRLSASPPVGGPEWSAWWQSVQASAADAACEAEGQRTLSFEGALWHAVLGAIPHGANLFVGNSMPVRDLDGFLRSGRHPGLRVYANRGVSGIDGIVSCAAGTAAADGAPTVLVLGDVSFFHDTTGLLAAAGTAAPLVVVVSHNGGGGIFRGLSQADRAETFHLFETPHDLDFRHTAEWVGASFAEPATLDALAEAVEDGLGQAGLTVIQVRTSSQLSTDIRRRIRRAAKAALPPRRTDADAAEGGAR